MTPKIFTEKGLTECGCAKFLEKRWDETIKSTGNSGAKKSPHLKMKASLNLNLIRFYLDITSRFVSTISLLI